MQHHPLWGEALGELQLSRLEEKEIKSCFIFAIASPSRFLCFMFSPCTSPMFSLPVLRLVMRAKLNYPLGIHFHLERLWSTSSLVWCQSLPMDSCASWSHTTAHYLHVAVMEAVTTSPLLRRKSIISLLNTQSTFIPNPRGLGRTTTRDGRNPLSFWLRGEDISL